MAHQRVSSGLYKSGYEPLFGHLSGGYFIGPDQKRYDFGAIRNRVKTIYPEVRGKHIREQLAALGILEIFDQGATPCSLPWSFG